LVLLNGRRAGPAGTRGEVSSFDFNTIPLSAVDRIEILKDGASSLYGSDAIAGVVNIITRTGDGGSLDAFVSIPSEDEGERTRFSATWGETKAKSSFRLTFDHDVQKELSRGSRDYFACGERYYFDQQGNRADIIDPRTGTYHCNDLAWGHVWLYDYGATNEDVGTFNLAQYDYDGDLSNYINPPSPAVNPGDIEMPPGWFLVNGLSPVLNADHPFQDRESLVPESSRTTFMAVGDYEFSNDMQGYAEVLLNRRKTEVNGYRQFWTYMYNENFFGGNSLAQGWRGAQWLSPTPITDHSFSNIDVDYTRLVAGLNGEWGEWFWDTSLQQTVSDGTYENAIIYRDSIEDQWFASGSCVGQTTSVRGVPCVDVPWLDPQFLAGNIDQASRDFLFGVDVGNTKYYQRTFEFTMSGTAFEMPNGYAESAFGFQYQRDEINDTPGEQTQLGNAWGSSSAGITKGATELYAVFGEIQLPLLSDLPAVEALNLTASARYTEVPDSGSDTTYKLGLAWHIGEGVSVRGSTGTSFRTPALFELFLNDQSSFVGNRSIDPCIRWAEELANGNISQTRADNCAADGLPGDWGGAAISATVLSGGGWGYLENETSESNTWGIVWRPEDIDMNVSIDYFDFLIENEVSQLGPAAIVFGCYDSQFFPNEPLCDLFERNSLDNRIDSVQDRFININRQRNIGWDFQFDITQEFEFGKLFFQTKHTYQILSEFGYFDNTVEDTNGRLGDPKHTGNMLLKFDRDNWHVSWFVNYIGKADNYDLYNETITFQGEEVRRVGHVDGVAYHSLSFGYNMEKEGIEFVFGVRNATDEAPPRISQGMGSRVGNSAFYSQYDWFGRSYFASIKYDF
jgi:iron complex outermembrane receptor protein